MRANFCGGFFTEGNEGNEEGAEKKEGTTEYAEYTAGSGGLGEGTRSLKRLDGGAEIACSGAHELSASGDLEGS